MATVATANKPCTSPAKYGQFCGRHTSNRACAAPVILLTAQDTRSAHQLPVLAHSIADQVYATPVATTPLESSAPPADDKPEGTDTEECVAAKVEMGNSRPDERAKVLCAVTKDGRECSLCLKKGGLCHVHEHTEQVVDAAELIRLSSLRMVKVRNGRGLEKPKAEYTNPEVMLPGATAVTVVTGGIINSDFRGRKVGLQDTFADQFPEHEGVYIWYSARLLNSLARESTIATTLWCQWHQWQCHWLCHL